MDLTNGGHSQIIRSFLDLTDTEMTAAGGKGRALARLAQAGFPVPDGFVILPTAFADQTLTAAAWTQIQAQLAAWRERQPHIAFAVRSSGLNEDSPQAAFAGQFATLLNATADEAVWEAIHAVYASRQSRDAAAYRQDRYLDEDQEMAVIVQALVPADCAGVSFSLDPVGRQRDIIVVNAAWGLGAGVMDGAITADTAWLYRRDFSLKQQHIVPKPVQLAPQAGGGIRSAAVPIEKQRAACLPLPWLKRVAHFSLACEQLFGSPQEVEWAIVGRKLWILQSRPITALPPELATAPPFTVDWSDENEQRSLWTLTSYSQAPTPPLPLEHDYMAARESIREETCRFLGLEGNQITRLWHGRAYVTPVPTGLSAADRRIRQTAQEDWRKRRQSQGLSTWDHWGPEIIISVERLRAFDTAMAAQSGNGAALADHLDEVLAVLRRNSFIHPCLSFKPGPAYFQAFAALTGLSGDKGETAAYQLLDSDENMLTRLIDGLYELAQLAHRDATIATLMTDLPPDIMARLAALPQDAPFLARLDRFLAEFGERIGEGYGSEMTILTPTWREEPTRLLRLAAVYLDPVREAPAVLRARARAAQDAQVEMWRAGHPDGAAADEFERQLAYARRNLTALEDHNHWIEQATGGLLRQAIMAAAQWLTQAGTLAASEEIFWLTFAEILTALRVAGLVSLAETAAARRAEWAQWARLEPPPILGVPPSDLPPRPPLVDEVKVEMEGENGRLQGVGASPGQAQGRARVVTDTTSTPTLSPGDVLVAPNAGPLWTPLFPILGGLVLESGSLGQHAAVTAREYGVPAVIACQQATQRIRDGAAIQVDGQAGAVTISEAL